MNQLSLFEDPSIMNDPIFHDLEGHILTAAYMFHRNNPDIYYKFRKYATQALEAGKITYGAKAIFERMRWEMEIEKKGEFKINNNYASFYARLLMIKDPLFKDYFEVRS